MFDDEKKAPFYRGFFAFSFDVSEGWLWLGN
jgi:hypothetical protein